MKKTSNSYSMYPSFFDHMTKNKKPKDKQKHLDGLINIGFNKNEDDEDYEQFQRYSLNIINYLALEKFWEDDGKVNIFIKDPSILEQMMSFEYKFNQNASLDFPHQTFAISLPKGFMVEGVEIPSFLVNLISEHEMEEAELDMISKYTDEFEHEHDSDLSKVPGIFIQYVIPENNDYMRLRTQEDETLESLNYHSLEAFMAQGVRNSSVDKSEHIREYYMHKILLALMISHSATDGGIIKEGLPFDFTSKLKMKRVREHKSRKYYFNLDVMNPSDANAEKGEHYRKWHFRNLQHSMYYSGEHENKKPGSRWTIVRDSIINKTVEAAVA